MPRLSLCMVIGICGMFLAPFGMLISKWAAMKAFVDAGQPLLLLVLVYGSATTLFYWTKWLGKITTFVPTNEAARRNRSSQIFPGRTSEATMPIAAPADVSSPSHCGTGIWRAGSVKTA